MPASYKNSLCFKKINKKRLNKIIMRFATPETRGFSYLLLFQHEYHEEIANILKENPTVEDVTSFALQNEQTIFIQRVKPTRIDLSNGEGTIDIEFHPEWEECQCGRPHILRNNWWEVKSLLFELFKNYSNYKFL